MQQNTSININSKYFIDRIENDIVQLARTLSVEHHIVIDEAKLMARRIVQNRLNQLLTKEEQDGIKILSDQIKEDIKNWNWTAGRNCNSKLVYELLKTMELL